MNVNNINYDLNKCFCRKNKYSNEQCSFKKKDNSFFCGIHGKSKNKDIFQVLIDLGHYNVDNNQLNIIDDEINENKENNIMNNNYINIEVNIKEDINLPSLESIVNKDNKSEEKRIYNSKEEFFKDLFVKKKNLNVYTLRQSIKNLGLKILIQTKQSRPDLIEELKKVYEKELNYIKNVDKIIKIQRCFKNWINKRLNCCINDTDILTFDNISDIPKNLLYIFKDKNTNNNFAYDIRTMIQIMNNDKPSCPYTCREYTIEEKIDIINEIDKRKRIGIKMDIEKIQLKPEEETEMRMIDVFHKINLLGNYTSHLWMKRLTNNQLIKFYTEAEDLWSYRLGMTHNDRKKYVKHGHAFLIPVEVVKNYNNLNKLRNVCLDEIERFVTNGLGVEERKLGAMWMLMAFVEVSFEAAEALPHLVQFY